MRCGGSSPSSSRASTSRNWGEWFAALDRSFLFLLILPFVVAAVGLWAELRRRDIRGTPRLGYELMETPQLRPLFLTRAERAALVAVAPAALKAKLRRL